MCVKNRQGYRSCRFSHLLEQDKIVLRVCVQNQSLQIPIFKNAKKQLLGELQSINSSNRRIYQLYLYLLYYWFWI